MIELFPEEMKGISEGIIALNTFMDTIGKIYGPQFGSIEIQLPETLTLKVIGSDGREMGWIDWTTSGDIGFITNDENDKQEK